MEMRMRGCTAARASPKSIETRCRARARQNRRKASGLQIKKFSPVFRENEIENREIGAARGGRIDLLGRKGEGTFRQRSFETIGFAVRAHSASPAEWRI